MFKGFSHSVTGASHEAIGLICQDSSAYEVCDRYAIAVIADGHGSKKHFRSHLGSQFAVEAAIETVRRFYMEPGKIEENLPMNHTRILQNIVKQIIANWNVRIFRHLEENPVTTLERRKFTPQEFEEILPEAYYGTTLVMAVLGKGYSFGLQIGDGTLTAITEDGKAIMPMQYDESAPANLTASMCNINAATHFRRFYSDKQQLIAVFASSDGLYTSFASEDDFLDYHTILASELTKLDALSASVNKNLLKRSHFGTEDDISISCVCNTALAEEKQVLLKKAAAENKATAAERKAKRIAALRNIE